ncbi:hypothetical protein BU24DRAFT_467660 [Aaosphaeria arxii CBS 175.79]|uniref:Secreted protein n=1 Tax=Aaosphaeria arxii CBS 175.79 TaxID=1450172 RepID=A0A6A5XAT5_9PLEO|nr:uncharacterized protein BU24DRAFT_467660 [Aaosphaeria arxii CBS 175.79]KAF2010185.1 hypothetical protein BU24DRAFT_467660 [Aaosphaeria arxii CBS 175.79]
MRIAAAAFALWVSSVIATPLAENLYTREEAQSLGLPIVDLEWTGQVVEGGPTVTLTGTAQSIYEEILKINPDFKSDEVEERGLEARQSDGTIQCGNAPYVTNYNRQCGEGISYLRRLGGGNGMCGTPAGVCTRVSCSNNCGMYLCSNSAKSVRCNSIANDIEWISSRCGRTVNGVWQSRGRLVFRDGHATELRRPDNLC